MVHFDTIWSWNCWKKLIHGRLIRTQFETKFFWAGRVEKFLKTRTLNGTFSRNLKRFFESWNCWEKFENKDAIRCILKIFETVFLFLNSLIKYLFLPDTPTCTFLLLFSRLKVIYLFIWLSNHNSSRTSKQVCYATRLKLVIP